MSEPWRAPALSDAAGTTVSAYPRGYLPELSQLPSRSQVAGGTRPQAALRARINAVILDLLLLGLVSQVLAAALRGTTTRPERALAFVVIQLSYFFLCEFASGRTIGKRAFHVRVVTVSGDPAGARQIALRNVLRIVDALPFFYASGLISMIRTGPARRQRIGDVAAGTTVVLDEGGKTLRTPSWLLPMLTLLATLVSLAIVVAVADSAAGAGGPGSRPLEGVWSAESTTISSVGYGNDPARSARWTIARRCAAAGGCSLVLTYEAQGEPPVSAPLRPRSGGWLAIFPALTYQCGEAPNGQALYWHQYSALALRFSESGRFAEGEERDFSHSRRCGYGAARRRWQAQFTGLG